MSSLLLYDLRKRFKSPVTWLLIWIILMMSCVKIDEIKSSRLNRQFSGNYNTEFPKLDVSMKDHIGWRSFLDEKTRNIIVHTAEEVIKADKERDYKNYNKYHTFFELINAKTYMSSDRIRFNAAEKQIKEIWDNVSDGIKYDDVMINYGGDSHYLMEFYSINHAKFHNYLYNNNLDVFYKDDINNISFSYNYLMDILPIVLIIATVVFMYNSINREVNNQATKLVLTQGLPRWIYYIARYISGTLHTLFIAYIPLTFVSTILGFKYGFKSLKYPVFYFPRGLKYLTPRYNYVKDLINPYSFISVSRIPKQVTRNYETVQLGDEIIPFYLFLILTILFTILFILFAVALIELISALINNEIISFTVITIIFLFGYKLSEPFIHERNYNLSPFTMNNAAAIVNGTYNVTALASFLILLFTTIILLAIGLTYFKRKEI